MKKSHKEWSAFLKPLGLNKKTAVSSKNKLTTSYLYNFGVPVSHSNKVVSSQLDSAADRPSKK